MLRREIQDGFLILRLDKPERLNAWDTTERESLMSALAQADADFAVKAAILTGTGERAFCAGADLSEKGIGVASNAEQRMNHFRAFYRALRSFSKPLVVALNGLAAGSAWQAIMFADSRIAHPGVKLIMAEINSGIPCITGQTILSWTAGYSRARELCLSGRALGAEEALQLGFIDKLVDAADVLPCARAVAEELAKKSPLAFAQTKLWSREMTEAELNAGFDFTTNIRKTAGVSDSILSGVQGFLKRSKH